MAGICALTEDDWQRSAALTGDIPGIISKLDYLAVITADSAMLGHRLAP